MIDRLGKVTKLITASSLAFTQYLSSLNYIPHWMPGVLLLLTFYSIEQLLESSKFLRKLILREQYIEGLWFDIIKKDEEIISVGYSTISYSEGKYQVTGEDFSTKNEALFSSSQLPSETCGHFQYNSVNFDGRSLNYTCTYNGGSNIYGEAQFNNNLRKYNGYFIHLSTGERFTYEGFPVGKTSELDGINKNIIINYLRAEKLMLNDKKVGVLCPKEEA